MNQIPPDTSDLSNLQGRRILVVDDDQDSQELLAFMLEQEGAETKTVSSAVEALKVLIQWQPDILLSDIGMPQVDGYTLIRQVRNLPREQGGHIPAIALTAYAGEVDRETALSSGFQQHIAKPIDPVECISVIMKLLEKP
ncbi:MAG: response regulator [Calothrix sp. C42_A2020_038]|nr:response regulator [Calothrix sp. C42_A2020_038]